MQKLLRTVLDNIVDNPVEEKFRCIKDAAVRKRCGDGDGSYLQAAAILVSLGFVVVDKGDAPWWMLPAEPDGGQLERLRDAQRRLGATYEPAATTQELSSPALPAHGLAVSLGDLARPAVLSVDTPYGSLCVVAYPEICVQLVSAADFPCWAAGGSGRHRGRPTGLAADHRALLSVCNLCEGFSVAAHWIDWQGSERTDPNLVSQPQRAEMVQTWTLHSFSLRLHPSQQVVLGGVRVTERPHHTGGHTVVFVTRGSPDSLDLAALAKRCQRTMESAGEDPREPPEGAGQQGRRPAPPPPGASRGRFWGS